MLRPINCTELVSITSNSDVAMLHARSMHLSSKETGKVPDLQ